MMRRLWLPTAALAVLCAGAPAVHALEPFKVFDRFTEKPLDPDRWAEGERIRAIKGGGLHLMQRSWGLSVSDFGLQFQNWSSNLVLPTAATALRSRINVTALEVNACPANASPAQARARIIGSYFNIGTPVLGSQVGDAIAQIRLTRLSNSADPAGVLRVQGLLSICGSADCNAAATVGNVVDLGTVAIGTPTVVQIQWDRGGKTFYFSRDQDAFAGTVAYAQADDLPPSVPFQQLSTRVDLPNCQSAPRVSSMVDARFDNVQVNQLALP